MWHWSENAKRAIQREHGLYRRLYDLLELDSGLAPVTQWQYWLHENGTVKLSCKIIRRNLLVQVNFNGKVWPPFDTSKCFGPTNCNANFETGDARANLFVALASMHTIFVREHNRCIEKQMKAQNKANDFSIVSRLQQINPRWNGDRLYHEARKIVGAQLQVKCNVTKCS